MKANDVTLLTPAEYFTDLAQTIAQAKRGERVAVATMSLWTREQPIGNIVDELEAAARRGVAVYLAIDAYNFLKAGNARPGPLWPRTTLPEKLSGRYEEQLGALERITTAGGHCAILNMPGRPFGNMHAGRSHIKAAVVGDTVYIGGCNLKGSQRLDVMAKWREHKAADWVYDTVRSMVEAQSTGTFSGVDRRLELDNATTLLVDAGVPDLSIILDNAYQLIDEAQDHIFLTCQYFPGGSTAQHLRAAFERGVRVSIYYSHPSAHGLEAPGHHAYALRERTRMPAAFFTHRLAKGRPLLHAKVLCTENGVMFGSHNYVTQGVHWGTAEIALRCNSPDFSDKLRTFMLQQIEV